MAAQQDGLKLPSPRQVWAHSTTSIQELSDALNDAEITAIESDIVMGYDKTSVTTNLERQPIMAHPPDTESDLPFSLFMEMNESGDKSGKVPTKFLKHLKLDVKEMDALDPILDSLSESISRLDEDVNTSTIYLNADILKGPGMRNDPLLITKDEFLNSCMKFLKEDEKQRNMCALSLGWRTDCRSFNGYTEEDVQEMKSIINEYEILKYSHGVVLALNARVLVKNPKSFDSILKEFPLLQLLIWTATGEPPISKGKIAMIKEHFERNGKIDQIGFDCQVASSFLLGIFYDTAIEIIGVFWNLQKFISQIFT